MGTLIINNTYCGPITTTTTIAPVEFCVGYGALYNYYAAVDERKITSSDDWEVPTKLQLEAFFDTLDTFDIPSNSYPLAGGYLKEVGLEHWDSPNTGAVDTYGLSIRGYGIRFADNYPGYEYAAWEDLRVANTIATRTPESLGEEWYLGWWGFRFYKSTTTISKSQDPVVAGHTLILIKDATGVPNGTTIVYVGNDGKTYNAVAINGIYLLTTPLSETKYRNGDWITGFNGGIYTPISDSDWWAKTSEAMCVYGDNYINMGYEGQCTTTTTTST